MSRSIGSGQDYCILGVSGSGKSISLLEEKFKRLGNRICIESDVLIFQSECVSVDDYVYIGYHSILKGGLGKDSGIHIKNGAYLGEGVYLDGAGGIEIGEHTTIGSGARILTQEPYYVTDDKKDMSFNYRKVVIGPAVFIGEGSVISPGVTIGKGAYIHPGTTVLKDVEDYGIVDPIFVSATD